MASGDSSSNNCALPPSVLISDVNLPPVAAIVLRLPAMLLNSSVVKLPAGPGKIPPVAEICACTKSFASPAKFVRKPISDPYNSSAASNAGLGINLSIVSVPTAFPSSSNKVCSSTTLINKFSGSNNSAGKPGNVENASSGKGCPVSLNGNW